jgi:hypothetical protein
MARMLGTHRVEFHSPYVDGEAVRTIGDSHMTNKRQDVEKPLRDGLESLPEPVDLSMPMAEPPHVETDEDLDEALQETFPASDPPASLRTA